MAEQPATESVVGKEENITPDGGLVKKIIKEGEGWQTPTKGADVVGMINIDINNKEKRRKD